MIRNRQIEILLYLLKVKKTTHNELALKFGVSIKTIQRDIDKLSVMGIPVTSKQGNQGGIYIDEHYKLSRSFFSSEDLRIITFGLTIFDALSVKKQKDQVLQKLALIAPELVYLFEEDATEYLVVDILKEKIDMTDEVYKQINSCLDEEYCLEIIVNAEQFIVAPISYVLLPEGLYLYAFDGEYLLIKVSNISHSKITNIEFERDFIPYKKNKSITFK